MTIRFTKPRHAERPPTVTITRDDGTTVGQASTDFFIGHDLTHFAVETSFGFTQAFYGLLNQGLDFDSFIERSEGSRKAPQLPMDAYLAEFVVGSLDAQRYGGDLDDNDVEARVRELYASVAAEPPSDFQNLLGKAATRRTELIAQYELLAAGESLELSI